MEIMFLPISLFFAFLATFCWKVYHQLEIRDYKKAKKDVLAMAFGTSLLSFVGLIVVSYALIKFLIFSLL